jgi:CO/xanthine dehydrogenase Mo-binding subunit
MEKYRCHVYGVAASKPPFSPYRGVARPGVAFAMELMIDAIARTVGRDPCAVRLENLVRGADMPFTNVAGKAFDSGDYPSSLHRVMAMLDHAGFAQRQAAARAQGRFSAWASPPTPSSRRTAPRCSRPGGCPSCRAMTAPRFAWPPMARSK